jgi:catechol 2,3-dioxygenase-like lactoylglutathione lyase family enzyme
MMVKDLSGEAVAIVFECDFVCEVFVALASERLERLVAFYEGWLAEPTVKTADYAEFRVGGLRLALFRPKAKNSAEFAAVSVSDANIAGNTSSSGPMSLCVEVADLEGAIAQLHTLGYPPPGPILSASHGREIYAYDPDGNRIILHCSRRDA